MRGNHDSLQQTKNNRLIVEEFQLFRTWFSAEGLVKGTATWQDCIQNDTVFDKRRTLKNQLPKIKQQLHRGSRFLHSQTYVAKYMSLKHRNMSC